ncbi:beta strand repeat-containing protein [Deinococcus cellulosilyticus]|uniref:Uncharacterized protein n=1 Tax=Deinococcus cellulosilyticus (strain DSM 18568 / NBRC 106333 / KACC 11606 / 5516J-15) TaxID=1223518 RepID=A0A511MWV5_DEIC1|nr:choice-of-anchor Q domain-containing protein [Deinococcus cellulosilyticus]GEM44657.1 hypothetical protein DC3_02920 [Deinococcus cellulosilyticus NBRC 106333 = KACC 11606]
MPEQPEFGRSRSRALPLGLLLLLVGCNLFAPPAPKTTPPNPNPPTPPTTGNPTPKGTLIEIGFEGIGSKDLISKTRFLPGGSTGIQKQDSGELTLLGGAVQFKSISNGSFDTDGSEVTDSNCDYSKGARYLYSTFLIRNATSAGVPYNAVQHNLTLVAVDANGSSYGTNAVSNLRKYDGSSYSDPASIANCIKPTHGLTYDPLTGISLRSNSADMQVYEEDDLPTAAALGVSEVFNYGFVVRSRTSTTDRSLPANPDANTYDGVVTMAVRLPKQSVSTDNPYKFSLLFMAFDDSVTRVTESLEEQASSKVQDRASLLGSGTQVQLLGGSTTPVSGYTTRTLCDTRVAGSLSGTPINLTDASGISCYSNGRVYVDASTTNTKQNGRTWATAYKNLTDALVAAKAGLAPREIWLADGTYYPDSGSKSLDRSGAVLTSPDNNTAATFYLSEGYKLYGGFSGNETSLGQRDPSNNLTILSGDVDANDTKTSGVTTSYSNISGSNSQHVVWIQGSSATPVTSSTVLDGLTITGGSATASGADALGGGLYCNGSATGNQCSPTLTDLTFKGNQASTAGGALFIAADGGGSNLQMIRGLFTGNATTGTDTSSSSGGGVLGVSALSGGYASPSFTNSLFYNNTSHHNGGVAVMSTGGSGTALVSWINSTLTANSAAGNGGAVYSDQGTPVFRNSILWNNTLTSSFNQVAGSGAQFQSSLIQNSGGSSNWDSTLGMDSGSNLDTTPLFVNAASNDYRLKTCSPAVDAGQSDLNVQTTDFAGNSRFLNDSTVTDSGDAGSKGAVIDLGALERTANTAGADCSVIRVNPAATGEGTGATWSDAATSLSEALYIANNTGRKEIWLKSGVYLPDDGNTPLDQSGKVLFAPSNNTSATFYLTEGVKIYGGFAGNEAARTSRNASSNLTILSGDIDQNDTRTSGVTLTNSGISGSNSLHVLFLKGTSSLPMTPATVLDGVTVTGGAALAASGTDSQGGALYCDGSGTGNSCSPTLTSLTFRGNVARNAGGALYLNGDAGTTSPVVTGGLFSGNAIIGANQTVNTTGGGAVALSGENAGTSSAQFTNALFYNNTSDHQAGALLVIGDGSGTVTPIFTNVTLSANTSAGPGGALYNRSATPVFHNSILWNNRVGTDPSQVKSIDSALPDFRNSLIQGSGGSTAWDASVGTDLGNNLDQMPAFVSEASNDYRLKTCSPAIDAGDSNLTALSTDFAGNNRFFNDTNTTDTGNAGGQAAVVDLGALERTSSLAGADCSVIRVNPAATGEGSGATWSDAATSLPEALYIANNTTARKEIWLKGGTYTPMDGSTQLSRFGVAFFNNALDRNYTFPMTAGVKLYGGFAGTESLSSQRNINSNVTILSADIDNNDTRTNGVTLKASDISGSNSYHLLYIVGSSSNPVTSSTEISGLTITGAKGDGSFPNNYGAGFYCFGEFTGNECSPTFTDVKVYGNTAVYGGGGGYLDAYYGGTSSPTFNRVLFSGNTTSGTATANASGGGALSVHVSENGTANPSFTNVVFYDNSSHNHGGGVLTYRKDTSQGTINSTYTNVTFYKDVAVNYGGAIYNYYTTGTVRNSILAGSSDKTGQWPVWNDNSTLNISYSVVERSISDAGTDGGNNVGLIYPYGKPLFNDASSGDLTLVPCSVATDAGNGSLLTETVDLNGNPRFSADGGVSDTGNQGGQVAMVDIGAYERQSDSSLCNVIRVDKDATGDKSGSSWKNAFTSLADALYMTRFSGTSRLELWIADGTYRPDDGYFVTDLSGSVLGTKDNNTSATFEIRPGVKLYGGFAGTETAESQRNPYSNITVLSGDIDQNDTRDSNNITLKASNISGSNSLHVMYLNGNAGTFSSSTVISGLVVTAGNAIGSDFYTRRGGGLLCYAENGTTCSPTFKDVRFVGNSALNGGGGVYLTMYNRGNSTATFTNVVFSQNSTTSGSSTNQGGGGLLIDGDTGGTVTPTFTNVVFDRNTTTAYGGGVHVYGHSANTSSPTFLNATFSGNTASAGGSGIYFFAGTSPQVANSVFWATSGASGSPIVNNGSAPSISYSLIQNGFSGSTWVSSQGTNGGNNVNLTADPFVSSSSPTGADGLWATSDDGLYLSTGNSGLNSGSNSAVSGLLTDLTGASRIQGGTVDRGAYERLP